MRSDELKRARRIVEEGPYSDRTFVTLAELEWSNLMDDLIARINLTPKQATFLRKLTKTRMARRKSDYLLVACNELAKRLDDEAYCQSCPNFDMAIVGAARDAFVHTYNDAYDEMILFFGHVESSSPV